MEILPEIDPIMLALRCPSCHECYLHHIKVEVFDELHVSIDSKDIRIDTKYKNNPSDERNGLLVHFYCECCTAISTLSLYQRKGMTCIEFSFEEDPPFLKVVKCD